MKIPATVAILILLAGCALRPPPQTLPEPCQRVRIDPAPLWTASAAWTHGEDRLLLIAPGRRSLLAYELSGELAHEVELDPLAELDYASPIRLEATRDGYVLGDKSRILWLDRSLRLQRQWRPFEHLEGVIAGHLSDFAVVDDAVYAYADFVVERDGDEEWRRGFVRIDLDEPEIVSLLELGLDDGEFNAYYYYSRRPYVTRVGKRPYVLRYSEPPQVLRASRGGLRPLYAARAEDGLEVLSLQTWNGRLYLLASRRPPPAQEPEAAATDPEPLAGTIGQAQLLAARAVLEEATPERLLIEIDPATGRARGPIRLPTEAQQVKVVPGERFWALIEETSNPNIGGGDVTSLMLLPSSWVTNGAFEAGLECPAEAGSAH